MAKELMEIGGFITEGAEIVNHDNTLSGNGTVDSPLGVVPGYNETVLYDGTPSSAIADIPLSENPANFEYIDVFASWTYNGTQHINCYIRIFGNETNFSLNGDGTYTNTSTTDFQTWRVVGDYALSSTKISVIRAYRVTSAGAGGNNTDTLKILKVVGINRKAQ
jgi:hypothetical protein